MLTTGNWRQPLLFIIICALLTGLIFSRAVLSITTALFVLLLFTKGSITSRLIAFARTPVLLLVSGLFFIPFVSGLWSADKATWLHMMGTKLPLLLLPLAFAQGFYLSPAQWKKIALFFLTLLLIATLYSTALYLLNQPLFDAAYLKAKVLPTPMHGDHLRFSLLVSLGVLVALFLFQKKGGTRYKSAMVMLVVWFVAYLHLLAARTGLVCLYLIIASVGVCYLRNKKNFVLSISLLIVLIALPLFAWMMLPTFKARLQYLKYDLTQVYHGHYIKGTTDGGRALSLKGGWHLLKEAPLGVGLGDIKHKMNDWYTTSAPDTIVTDKLFPSSEWLVHALIAGWPGAVLFTIIIAAPFFMRFRFRFWWCVLNVVLAISILFDTGLSTQFGIFIHAFFILMWWQYAAQNRSEQNNASP